MFGFNSRRDKLGLKKIFNKFVRSFRAASVSRELGSWRWDNGFTPLEIQGQIAVIRARSRELQKNNPYFKRAISLFVLNVVGTGFNFKASSVDREAKPDIKAATRLERLWWLWSRRRDYVDASGRMNLAAFCRFAAMLWHRDGECFVHIDTAAQNKFGISLRAIRPDACPAWFCKERDDCVIRGGVELDKLTLRPRAYYFESYDSSATTHFFKGREYRMVRVPADNIVHLYSVYDPSQTRGIPHAFASMYEGKMLEKYNESELVAAREEACTLGIFHAPAGREDEIADLSDEKGELQRECEAGQNLILPQGWNFDHKTPQHPNREVTAFKNTMIRDIAAGMDLEYSTFSGDWNGVSYSSVRAGMLSERDAWMDLQDDFVNAFLVPIFEVWLKSILHLSISGEWAESDFDRLSEVEFRGRRWAWVDPMKDVRASQIAVENGWKTNSQIATEYGCDYDDNIEELARERDLRSSFGFEKTEELNNGKT